MSCNELSSTEVASEISRTVTKTRKTQSCSQTRDDLTKVRGIGPASQKVLLKNGIESFEQLAQMNTEELNGIFEKQSNRFSMIDVSTWATQARAFADSRSFASEEETLLNEVNEIRDMATSANRSTEKPAVNKRAKEKQSS